MGFVKVVFPPKEACSCQKPDSKEGHFFGPGTVWVCDICGAAWEFIKSKFWSDQRDNDSGYLDEWKRSIGNDGPDNREHPQVARVTPLGAKLKGCAYLCDVEVSGRHARDCTRLVTKGGV